jgi:hypothetical protein
MTTPPAAACQNCGAPLTGEFCASCGQKVPHPDLTLREFLHETTEQLVNWDGKIPQTLKTLLLKPGALTIDFLEGRRARWLMPLRVYLICSVAYFLARPMVETFTNRSTRDMAQISLSSGSASGQLTAQDTADIAQGLPARILGKERLLRAAADPRKLNREINASFPKAMFLLVPFFALLTRVMWGKRVPRYPAHLYLALHVNAAWFAALFVATMIIALLPQRAASVVGLAMAAYILGYGLAAFRRVFGESWPRTIAKSAVVAVVYMFGFGVAGMGLLLYAITRM